MKRGLVAITLISCFAAACGGSGPEQGEAPPDAIVMTSNAFEPDRHTVERGGTITLVNETTGALHILVIGDQGIAQPAPGAPDFGGTAGHRSERGEVWTTPAWETAGTFRVTCTVHPEMNLDVTVT